MIVPRVFLVAFFWRLAIGLLTCTFFQPDEFYQGLEVAHHAVFGYGHLTWEWTASPPIRSVVFPILYTPAFWLLKLLKWDESNALITAPKIIQALFAALTDVSTWSLSKQVLGDRYCETTFILSLTSFFHILALGRTLSNSIETTLTVSALCFWPWHHRISYGQLQLAFILAAFSCMIRPTSAVIWIFLTLELLGRNMRNLQMLTTLITVTALTAIMTSIGILCVDTLYYGKPTFTPLNFLVTNLSSVSLFYGRSPWHYYLFQGIPIVLNISIPPFLSGSWSTMKSGTRHLKTLLASIIWGVLVYSTLGHKEWRFIHPLLPLCYIFASKALVDGKEKSKKRINKKGATVNKNILSKRIWLCSLGIFPGIYVMRFHGRAQISVMHYLRSLDSSVLHSVGFLMPCHSTPWQSYLHRPELNDGKLWAIGCEPPLNGTNIVTYKDQTVLFYNSPLNYLKTNFPDTVDETFPPSLFPSTKPGTAPPADGKWDHQWPSHLIFFGALLSDIQGGPKVEAYIRELGYGEVWSETNGFEEDWRRRGGVKVWKWQGLDN